MELILQSQVWGSPHTAQRCQMDTEHSDKLQQHDQARQRARLKKFLLKSFLQSFKNFLHLQWLWIPDESPLLQGVVGLGGLQ